MYNFTNEDIKNGKFIPASNIIKDELNELFETDKYSSLKILKNSNGRGKSARYFYVIQVKKVHDNSYSNLTMINLPYYD